MKKLKFFQVVLMATGLILMTSACGSSGNSKKLTLAKKGGPTIADLIRTPAAYRNRTVTVDAYVLGSEYHKHKHDPDVCKVSAQPGHRLDDGAVVGTTESGHQLKRHYAVVGLTMKVLRPDIAMKVTLSESLSIR